MGGGGHALLRAAFDETVKVSPSLTIGGVSEPTKTLPIAQQERIAQLLVVSTRAQQPLRGGVFRGEASFTNSQLLSFISLSSLLYRKPFRLDLDGTRAKIAMIFDLHQFLRER